MIYMKFSKKLLIPAMIMVVLGALIAAGPWTIFPVCESGNSSMLCHYTAEAEIAIGSMIALFGLVLLFVNNSESLIIIGVGEAALGIWAILIPTYLIGICGSNFMECNTTGAPALMLFGGLTILVSFFLIFKGWKNMKK